MTQTIQPRSWAHLSETGKDLTIDNKPKTETEDVMGLLLQIFDGLNNLYEKLNRLNYVIQRKNIEQFLYKIGETK
jgi:hypothetical protein